MYYSETYPFFSILMSSFSRQIFENQNMLLLLIIMFWRSSKPKKKKKFITDCIFQKTIIPIGIRNQTYINIWWNNLHNSTHKVLRGIKIWAHSLIILSLHFNLLSSALLSDHCCWWVLIKPWTWWEAGRYLNTINLLKFFFKLTTMMDGKKWRQSQIIWILQYLIVITSTRIVALSC